ncbi:MAG TPA: hypothetical protein VKA63_03625 [Candidatus Krumholzibacteria bacterium]|nr:hypothetical protein [Candidatus Krumholzibacteria bacterium]
MELKAQPSSSPAGPPRSLRDALVFGLLCGIVALLFELRIRAQGLDFLQDGIWLLSASILHRGGALYREIVTREGPFDAELLRGVFLFLGEKAAALAFLKALVDALAAALGSAWAFHQGKKSLAWLTPLGILILAPFPPRYLVVGVAAALLTAAIARARGSRQAEFSQRLSLLFLASGFCLSLAAVSGVDGLLLALLLAGGTLRVLPRETPALRSRANAWLWLGAAIPLLGVLLGGVLQGNLLKGFDQVLLAGTERSLHLIADFSPAKLGHGLWDARLAISPFKSLMTGESLHELFRSAPILRVLCFRLQNLLLFALVAWAWSRPSFRRAQMRPLMILATAPLVGTILHSDAMNSHRAWLAVLILLPLLLSELRPASLRAAAAGLVLLAWSLPLMEDGWLATHTRREDLRWWQRPRAGIALDTQRVSKLDSLIELMKPENGGKREPLLVWPNAPALNFLMDAPLALPQAVLLPGRVRHKERLAPQLAQSAPRHILLSLSWNYTGEQIEELAPGCWDFMRQNYRVLGSVIGPDLRFRVLQHLDPGEKISELTLPQRLPDVEQSVGNGVSPALRTKFEIGQSFRVGPRDLEGFAVRWRTDADSLTVGVRIRIWKWEKGGWNRLMEIYELEVPIHGDLDRSFLRFGPVEDSAGQLLAITFELKEDPGPELRFVWHDEKNGAPDLYPEGAALVELEPQDADLYFFSW